MTQQEIFKALKEYKIENQAKYNIQKIGVFGSVAKGNPKRNSDIDIVVELAIPKMFDLIGIKQDLEKITKKKVDIVTLRKTMNPFLKQVIEKEAIYV
jgi:hypothetical protein